MLYWLSSVVWILSDAGERRGASVFEPDAGGQFEPLTTDQYFWAREHLAVRLTVLRVSSLLATRDV